MKIILLILVSFNVNAFALPAREYICLGVNQVDNTIIRFDYILSDWEKDLEQYTSDAITIYNNLNTDESTTFEMAGVTEDLHCASSKSPGTVFVNGNKIKFNDSKGINFNIECQDKFNFKVNNAICYMRYMGSIY